MRILILIAFISSSAFAADEEMKLNFHKTMHIYDTTAHVRIMYGEEKRARNFDYNVCTYGAEVINVYKGELGKKVVCLMASCSKAANSVNKTFLVSFNNTGSQCYFLGAGDKTIADNDLLLIAERYAAQN